MRIIIAGGRDFNNYNLLKNKCFDIIRDISSKDDILNNKEMFEIVCGKARGADTLGELFAKELGFKVKYFPAEWDIYGKSAGDVSKYPILFEDWFILSHEPRYEIVNKGLYYNIHGHLHSHGNKYNSNILYNVAVERNNYTPVDFEVIKNKLYGG